MKSIIHVDNTDCCFLCGQYATETHHCIHGTANRKLADQDGLTVRLCSRCHRNLHDKGTLDKELQRIAQQKWMEINGKTLDEFIRRYGRSYL